MTNETLDGALSGVHGDRPLNPDGTDLLGFTPVAEQLAKAFMNHTTRAAGAVIGLEGEWGSGKSSLLALTEHALQQVPADRRPAIQYFRPWIIGNRDALLLTLFDDLARTVDEQLANENTALSRVTNFKSLPENLRTYGGRLGALAPVASIASVIGIPGAGILEKLLKAAKGLGSADKKRKPLADIKEQINTALVAMPRPIVVVIDDVDRLEPDEIAEVLRLVRSVADFQNVVYVLCYDPSIVACAIQTAMRMPNGRAYLEKIVQVTVRVPLPEPFALRRMFSIGLGKIAVVEDDDSSRRLASVIDVDGGNRLTTPRAVNRALDALRFFWPALHGKVDLADLVWLQLIKMDNPALYDWVEAYSASMGAYASGRVMIEQNAKQESFERLVSALEHDNVTFDDTKWTLMEFLPGIVGTRRSGSENQVPIFEVVPEDQRRAATAGRRLSSPDHHRIYFALTIPSSSIDEADYLDLWRAADEGSAQVVTLFRAWFADNSSGFGTKAERMLNRLRGVPGETLSVARCHSILLALAQVLDDPTSIKVDDSFLDPASWREAKYLLPILRAGLGCDAKPSTARAFREGHAISWLVYIFRGETFAHGRFGSDRTPERDWIFTEVEFNEIVNVMHTRFDAMSMPEILSTPQPIQLLFAWNQSGGAAKAKTLVESFIGPDRNLLDTLDHMSSSVHSTSKGEYLIIRRESLAQFLDYDDAYSRVEVLAAGQSELMEHASIIKQRLDHGGKR